PGLATSSEKPKLGWDGATTWKDGSPTFWGRDCILILAPLVNKMHLDAAEPIDVDAGRELGNLVEFRLCRTPVKALLPSRHETLHVRLGASTLPVVGEGRVRWEGSGIQFAFELCKLSLGHCYLERADFRRHSERLFELDVYLAKYDVDAMS
ncbi:hypothetical protein OOU_Y34scaffold00278g30, partial [Pyricularia oryzae Y34]